uniref:Uncharacterized protein n=1 Tax=Pelusios castaneus TaxID=367368 RepID=A0A8C8S7V2_9SAUR
MVIAGRDGTDHRGSIQPPKEPGQHWLRQSCLGSEQAHFQGPKREVSSPSLGAPTPSNRLCAQRPQDPPHVGMKRKCSTQGGDAEGEGEEETLFYMKVRAMNGVSVTWETRTGFRAISKRPRLFKANYTGGESFAGSDWSSTHTKSDLGDVELEAESSVEEQAEEQAIAGQKMSHMDIAPLPIMQGVRCLACCRLFPSLEALIEHVKHGLREGFSCRVYNRVLGQFRARKKSPRRSRRLREQGETVKHRQQSLSLL